MDTLPDDLDEINQTKEVCMWCENDIDIGDGVYLDCSAIWVTGWYHKNSCELLAIADD
jgi:hypothetical protein